MPLGEERFTAVDFFLIGVGRDQKSEIERFVCWCEGSSLVAREYFLCFFTVQVVFAVHIFQSVFMYLGL